jgi:predicted enzyme related to lactoylglutathione lyase
MAQELNLDSAVLYSDDIEKVVPLYRDILVFKIDYHQEGRFISFIFPNGARLGIKTRREEREIPGHQTVFITVDNIEQEYKRLKREGVEFAKELVENPWGKEFSILDADKNKILYIRRPD